MRRLLALMVIAAAAVTLLVAGGSDARSSDAVRVTLDEWTVGSDAATVAAGPVTFETRNDGELEHELQIIRTDRPADELPRGLEGVHYEEAGELVLGEPHEHSDEPHGGAGAQHIAPAGGTRRDVVDLEPGRYVLLCNLPGHYAAGQHAALTVR